MTILTSLLTYKILLIVIGVLGSVWSVSVVAASVKAVVTAVWSLIGAGVFIGGTYFVWKHLHGKKPAISRKRFRSRMKKIFDFSGDKASEVINKLEAFFEEMGFKFV